MKAGAFAAADREGIALVIPDTSPRGGDGVADADTYDLGQGAGFYVDATEEPWKENYQMYSYITKELPGLISEKYGVGSVKGVFGHSMGGESLFELQNEITRRFFAVSSHYHYLNNPSFNNNFSFFASQGHGALTCAFRDPQSWASVSALAPISNPTKCPWGQKAFENYLGSVDAGKDHDAALLLKLS